MIRFTAVAVAGFVALGSIGVRTALAQQSTAQRTSAIVASFNKSKHAIKERHGVRVEKYKEVRSEPVVLKNLRDYSGSYEAEGLGLSFDLRVDQDGHVTGNGSEAVNDDQTIFRVFTLRNARIDGALLTATKVYERGGTESFEGVFINKTSFDSPTDTGHRSFGLGVIGHTVILAGNVGIDRVFYERKH